MRRFPWALLAGMAAWSLFGCYSEHKIDSTHEIKPIHITIDVNVKIQNELKKKFAKNDKIEKKISDEEAVAALEQYLNGNY